MTEREALKLALEALKRIDEVAPTAMAKLIIPEIEQVLAQPEQEPVAWVSSEELLVMRGNALGGAKDWRINVGLVKQDGDVGLYTTPPQRTWVNATTWRGLTDEEVESLQRLAIDPVDANGWGFLNRERYANLIETKLKEKNT